MLSARPAPLLGLTLLTGLLGWAATLAVPAGAHGAGMWPVGLVTGLVVLAPRRTATWLVPVVGLVGLVSFALADRPLPLAAGYALGLVLEVLVVRGVLTGGPAGQRLVDDLDLVRFTLAGALGALTGAGVFALSSALSGQGTPWQVGVATFGTHLASQLIILAFFMRPLDHSVGNGTFERALRWGLTLVVTLLAFVPSAVPAMVFVVLPMIGWSALRAPMREALWKLLAIGTLTSVLTEAGLGPFAARARAGVSPVELDAMPQQGFLLGCVLVCVPFAMAVSRQRRSAAEAAGERERLRRIVRGVNRTGIIEVDQEGKIRLFNPGAELLLGYSEAEVLGRSPRMFHTDEEIARQAALLGVPPDYARVCQVHAASTTGRREWKSVRKDGHVRDVSMTLERICDRSGTPIGYLGTAEDITERVRTESALEKALDTERLAVARLTEVDRSKDAFVSSVSHELRTPITNIVGYLELLIDGAYGEPTQPQAEALGRIDTNSHRLLELIDDLLTLSSIESLDVELVRQPVDLRSVVERCAGGVRRDLLAHGQHLELRVPPRPVVVLGDEEHLHRMVANLATNAVKFTPDGGTITLRVAADACGASIEVEDTGVGIPAEEQGQLFNRFYRSSYAQAEAVQGSGLGLSIARSIAQRHGARISATSVPGEGSVFTVRFTADDEPVLHVV